MVFGREGVDDIGRRRNDLLRTTVFVPRGEGIDGNADILVESKKLRFSRLNRTVYYKEEKKTFSKVDINFFCANYIRRKLKAYAV